MTLPRILLVVAVASALASGAAIAQTKAERDVQRDINQQQRIQEGLKSGDLNSREAGRLEREQQVINRMEAGAMKDGKISRDEQQKLDRAKYRASQDIHRQKHDAQEGNPASASSQRLQADVHRNVRQQKRIEHGLDTGKLTRREAAVAEAGQAHAAGKQAGAAASGQVSAAEQARIQAAEDRHSKGVYRKKHNARKD